MIYSVLKGSMYKNFLLASASLFSVDQLSAQEWNLGVHLNPILTHPVVSHKSVYDKEVKPVAFTLGFNAGLNLNYKVNEDVSLETGVNAVQKSMRFNDRRGSV